MVKLVNTYGSGSYAERLEGSTPSLPIEIKKCKSPAPKLRSVQDQSSTEPRTRTKFGTAQNRVLLWFWASLQCRILISIILTMKKTFKQSNLIIIPLGGLSEVGRNMIVLEWQGKILIIDMGFRMPEEDMPGVDYIIPNISYLKGKEKNILGVVFTHGHYDHIGAVPYLIEKLGYPLVFVGQERRPHFHSCNPQTLSHKGHGWGRGVIDRTIETRFILST